MAPLEYTAGLYTFYYSIVKMERNQSNTDGTNIMNSK